MRTRVWITRSHIKAWWAWYLTVHPQKAETGDPKGRQAGE